MQSHSQAEKADLTYATATELTAAMGAREVSSAELTEAAISRIERFDQDINAVCVPDFDRALTAARAADAARAKGDVRPLLGVPITVKESFNVAGLTTTWGIPAFKDAKATEDAVAVARLKTAGAVVLGKTNVPSGLGDLQTYNDLYGVTCNPWNLARTAGGSSGGSAAALAAGHGALSIGSDIAGSLRAPAHYCGVYAHKPLQGLLPTRGHTTAGTPPLAYERDLVTIGPMARGARDLSLMLDLLADPDETAIGIAHALALPPARHDDLAAFRVLVVDTHPLIPTASSVRAAISDLADRLSAVGAKVARESKSLPDQVEAARLYMRLLLASWGPAIRRRSTSASGSTPGGSTPATGAWPLSVPAVRCSATATGSRRTARVYGTARAGESCSPTSTSCCARPCRPRHSRTTGVRTSGPAGSRSMGRTTTTPTSSYGRESRRRRVFRRPWHRSGDRRTACRLARS
nr:amidase family protein [Nonomuraea terrae]